MRAWASVLGLAAPTAVTFAAAAAASPASPDARLWAIVRPVSSARIKATVAKLVSFGTRHTLSSQTDPKRGIGAALKWTEAELNRYAAACGGCLTVTRSSDIVSNDRIPTPTRVVNVFAVQRGSERPGDVVLITGDIDTRVSDPLNSTADAPGANDNGSGAAAVLEAARVLSKRKFAGTIVYALLSGEEQGLVGARIMADYAKAQGWNVIANLNNDIIGNSCGSDGVCNDKQVRIFSEGPRWQGREELAALQRSLGGENDSPSRNLSRFLDTLAERVPDLGIDVMQIWRNDRFGRGGDHTEFLNAGFPAVRFTVAVENYNWQHQDVRIEKGIEYGDTIDKMDFPYLAKVAKLNIAALASIASAPPPPEPKVEGAVSTDTTVSWRGVSSAVAYKVWWRRTDANNWQVVRSVLDQNAFEKRPSDTTCHMTANEPPWTECKLVLPHVRVDDWVFGVSSVSKDGFESPVASAVPGGAFKPYVAPPAKTSP